MFLSPIFINLNTIPEPYLHMNGKIVILAGDICYIFHSFFSWVCQIKENQCYDSVSNYIIAKKFWRKQLRDIITMHNKHYKDNRQDKVTKKKLV